MRKVLILIAVFASGLLQAQVYRSVDKDGNVIFSDQQTKGAVEVEVKELETVKSLGVPESNASGASKKQPPQLVYKNIAINNPQDDQAVRENSGNLNVTVLVEPKLRGMHKLVLYLDGEEYAAGSSTTFQLENLDRGTHQLRAAVVDADGRQQISSKSVKFHMLRQSVLQPKPKPKAN